MKKDYHHGDLKHALIQAAVAQMGKTGVEGLTLRDLARQVGVSHMAPYRHFEDRQALLSGVAETGHGALLAAMRTEAGAETDPVARLDAAGRAYVRFAQANPAMLGLMLAPEIDGTCDAAAEETLQYVLGIITDGQKSGAFRAGDPVTLAVASWSSVHGLAVLLANGHLCDHGLENISQDELVAAVSRLMREGLTPR